MSETNRCGLFQGLIISPPEEQGCFRYIVNDATPEDLTKIHATN